MDHGGNLGCKSGFYPEFETAFDFCTTYDSALRSFSVLCAFSKMPYFGVVIPRRSIIWLRFRAPFAHAFGVNGQSSQIGPEGPAPLPLWDMKIFKLRWTLVKIKFPESPRSPSRPQSPIVLR